MLHGLTTVYPKYRVCFTFNDFVPWSATNPAETIVACDKNDIK